MKLLLFVVIILMSPVAGAVEPLVLSPDEQRVGLFDSLEILEDPDGDWSVDKVAALPMSGNFKPATKSNMNIGFTSSVIWLRFTLAPTSKTIAARDWRLCSLSRATDSLELFVPDRTRWDVYKEGYLHTGWNPFPAVLPIAPSSKTPQTYYIRVASKEFLSLEFELVTRWRLHIQTMWTHVWHGGFFGLMDVLLLLNILMLFYFKGRSYLYYSLYLLAVSPYLLVQNGYMDWIFPRPMAYAWGSFHCVMIGLIALFSTAFTRSFLKTADNTPRLDYFLKGQLVFAGMVIGITPFAGIETQTYGTIALGLIAPFAVVLPGVLRLRQGFTPAKLYLIAWGIMGVGSFYFALPILKPVPGPVIFQVGCLINGMLLTVALVEQMRRYRRERESAVLAQRESEELYRTIFDNTGTSVMTFNKEWLVVLANEEWTQLVGCPLAEMAHTLKWTAFVTEDSLEKIETDFAQSADGVLKTQSLEIRVRGRDGRVHDGIITIAPVPGNDLWVSSFQDLTDLKRAQQQMYHADKMAALGQIIAGVAHEINNPNNFIYFNIPIMERYIEAIRPLLDRAVEGESNPRILNMPYDEFLADVFKLLENMAHGSKRITEIVADLKGYIGGHRTEQKKPEALEQVVGRVMTLVGKQVRKMVNQFDVHVEPHLPLVNINAGRIEQVLINLIINAGQAADKSDAKVALHVASCADDRGRIEIRIEDNGSGIPKENLEKIFDPFFTSKSRGEGTGLGLAISQQIVADHGGEISVESTEGEGTLFIIQLPVHLGD